MMPIRPNLCGHGRDFSHGLVTHKVTSEQITLSFGNSILKYLCLIAAITAGVKARMMNYTHLFVVHS